MSRSNSTRDLVFPRLARPLPVQSTSCNSCSALFGSLTSVFSFRYPRCSCTCGEPSVWLYQCGLLARTRWTNSAFATKEPQGFFHPHHCLFEDHMISQIQAFRRGWKKGPKSQGRTHQSSDRARRRSVLMSLTYQSQASMISGGVLHCCKCGVHDMSMGIRLTSFLK